MLFALLGFILGTILGSLALALAQRSLDNKTFFGRSHCPHCKHLLNWFDLIPLFSYLSLQGKCRYCHKKIGIEYPVVELITGLVTALLFWQAFQKLPVFDSSQSLVDYQFKLVTFTADLIAKLFLATVFIIVAVTDLKETIIPDRITFPAIKIILVYLLALVGYRIWYLHYSLSQSSLGTFLVSQTDYFWRHSLYSAEPLTSGLAMAVIVGLFFLSLIIITKGRGMGGGDLKLGILIGLFLGYPLAIIAILLSFFSGSVVAILLILLGKKNFGQTIPFGPFLSLGSIFVLIWSSQVATWYNNLNPVINTSLPLFNQFPLK